MQALLQRPCCQQLLVGPQRARSKAPLLSSSKQHRPLRARLLVDCRQGRDPRNGQRYNFRDQQPGPEFSFNSYNIPQDQLWKLALPAAAVVGVAALAGPLIIGLTLGAVAMGAAFSMGAFALSTMFLPLIMMGVFGMMSFGAFATMGMFLVIPKLILTFVSVGVLGAGAALGWGGVNFLTSLQQKASGSSSGAAPGRGTAEDPWVDQLPKGKQQQAARYRNTMYGAYSSDMDQTTEDEQRAKEMAQELRDFDELLASKEQQKRRQARDIRID